MNGYGLSAARFNRFFLDNSAAVCARMARVAGSGAAPALAGKVFNDAKSAMDKVPTENLTGAMCSEILNIAVQRALDGLSGDRGVVPGTDRAQEDLVQEEESAPSVAVENPEGEPTDEKHWEGAPPVRPDDEPVSEADYMDEQADVGGEGRESGPTPPAGWLRRGEGERDCFDGRLSCDEPVIQPASVFEEVTPVEEPAPQIRYVSQPVPPAESTESLRAELADKVEGGRGHGSVWNALLIAALAVLVLVLMWALAGVLMKQGLLPSVDLGYDWFDRVFFPFF